MRKVASVVAITAAATIGGAGIASASDQTVEEGDTLAGLAGRDWGYACIVNVAEQRIPDCDTLEVGQPLRLDISASERARIDRLVAHWRATMPVPEPRHEVVFVQSEPEPAAPAPQPAVTTPPVTAAPQPAAPTSGGVWDQLAQCESGGNWAINTGNGYSGGLQFHPQTWAGHGGQGQAHEASREEQIRVAERVLDSQGWGAWPACSSQLGLR